MKLFRCFLVFVLFAVTGCGNRANNTDGTATIQPLTIEERIQQVQNSDAPPERKQAMINSLRQQSAER